MQFPKIFVCFLKRLLQIVVLHVVKLCTKFEVNRLTGTRVIWETAMYIYQNQTLRNHVGKFQFS